jgi:hypothetical protein
MVVKSESERERKREKGRIDKNRREIKKEVMKERERLTKE